MCTPSFALRSTQSCPPPFLSAGLFADLLTFPSQRIFACPFSYPHPFIV